MPLCSFPNFKLAMSRHMKELRGAPKARGSRPRPIWPMRKSVTAFNLINAIRTFQKLENFKHEIQTELIICRGRSKGVK